MRFLSRKAHEQVCEVMNTLLVCKLNEIWWRLLKGIFFTQTKMTQSPAILWLLFEWGPDFCVKYFSGIISNPCIQLLGNLCSTVLTLFIGFNAMQNATIEPGFILQFSRQPISYENTNSESTQKRAQIASIPPHTFITKKNLLQRKYSRISMHPTMLV